MKSKWLAIAISTALPAAALAQQDAKDNINQNHSAEVQKAKVDSEQARAETEMANAKAAIRVQLDQANADQAKAEADTAAQRELQVKEYDRALSKLREQKQIKAAWLGLSATPAPAALRKQLKLPDGTGLVVDFIQPGSPAAKAGLKQYDLLTKFGDQLLINSEQLSVLVRTFKAGNKVKVEFLREGDHQSVDAELVEHEVPPLADEIGASPFQFVPQLDATRSDDNSRTYRGPKPERITKSGNEEHRTLTLVDGKNRLSVDVTEGHRTLSVVDSSNRNAVAKYPIDTDEQINAVPTEVRKPLSKILALMGTDTARIDGKPSADAPKP